MTKSHSFAVTGPTSEAAARSVPPSWVGAPADDDLVSRLAASGATQRQMDQRHVAHPSVDQVIQVQLNRTVTGHTDRIHAMNAGIEARCRKLAHRGRIWGLPRLGASSVSVYKNNGGWMYGHGSGHRHG